MGYCPFSGLCRDREFWPCVATMALCRDRFWLGTAFLCCDKESLVYVTTGLVVPGVFYRDRVFPRVGYSCRDRVFDVAIELAKAGGGMSR